MSPRLDTAIVRVNESESSGVSTQYPNVQQRQSQVTAQEGCSGASSSLVDMHAAIEHSATGPSVVASNSTATLDSQAGVSLPSSLPTASRGGGVFSSEYEDVDADIEGLCEVPLQQHFEEHIKQLQKDHIPSKLGGRSSQWSEPTANTFIFPGPNATLRSDPTPADFVLSRSRIILFKPDAIWRRHGVKVKCPCCKSSAGVTHDSWGPPRRVVGLKCTYWLVSFKYVCDGYDRGIVCI